MLIVMFTDVTLGCFDGRYWFFRYVYWLVIGFRGIFRIRYISVCIDNVILMFVFYVDSSVSVYSSIVNKTLYYPCNIPVCILSYDFSNVQSICRVCVPIKNLYLNYFFF